MPVLPLIDLMLLSGWTSLFVGFVLKAIHLSTSYRPTIFGLTPFDFLLIALAALLFAIALAARTWVKTQEPAAIAARRHKETMDAWHALSRNGVHEETALPEPGREPNPEDVLAASARNPS